MTKPIRPSTETANASKYDELDKAIVARIRSGHSRFYEICTTLEELAKPHVTGPYGGHDRVVDRRLQALRKKRIINCHGIKWSVP